MDEEERKRLIERLKQVIKEEKGDLPAEFQKLAGRLHELEQRVVSGGPSRILANAADPFAAEAFVQRLNAVKEGQPATGRVHLPGMKLTRLKALISGPGVDSPSATYPGVTQRGPTIGPVVRPLTLLDFLPSTPVNGTQYEFVQLSRTNGAAVQQGEGATKGQSNFESALVTAKIATIAHWTQASRQVLADNPQLGTMLRNILAIDALEKFERLLISGNGTTDEILGLVPQSVTLDTDEELAPDIISQGLAMMYVSGYVANVTVLHPYDWHRLRTLKAEGDGQYMVGSWANPAAPNVWNTPIVPSSAITEGTALLLDTSRIQVLDREQVTVMLSTEDRDNFIKNLVTLLAELRGGLAVYDTGAVGLVNLPVPSP